MTPTLLRTRETLAPPGPSFLPLTVLAVLAVTAAACGYPYTPCFLDPDSCQGTSDGTADGSGDDGGADGGADDDAVPEPFQAKVFVAQHLEYDNFDELGNTVYAVPETCLNSDIVDDTFELAAALDEASWSVRYAFDRERNPGAEVSARPENWAESYPAPPFGALTTPSDEDDADAYDLTIYSGHGGAGLLATNFPGDDDGESPFASCDVDLQADVRLGAFCGRKAKIAMYSASCVAGFDEFLCPPPPSTDAVTYTMWDGWPDVCWEPFNCTLFRSYANHTLAFKDSPAVSEGQQAVWYGLAAATTPAIAWINTHAVDEASGQANQPAVLLVAQGGSEGLLNQKLYHADVVTGDHLEQIIPSEPMQGGLIHVTYDGHSGIFDASGEEVVFGEQTPELKAVCFPEHGETCYDGANPEGVGWNECPDDPG